MPKESGPNAALPLEFRVILIFPSTFQRYLLANSVNDHEKRSGEIVTGNDYRFAGFSIAVWNSVAQSLTEPPVTRIDL